MTTEQDIEELLQAAYETQLLAATPKLRGALALLEQSGAFDTDTDVEAAAALVRSCLDDLDAIGEQVDRANTAHHAAREAAAH